MKKYLLALLTLFVILSPNVKAETFSVSCDYSNNYSYLFEKYGQDNIIDLANKMYSLYTSKYKDSYPFYYINLFSYDNSSKVYVSMRLFDFAKVNWCSGGGCYVTDTDDYSVSSTNYFVVISTYNFNNSSFEFVQTKEFTDFTAETSVADFSYLKVRFNGSINNSSSLPSHVTSATCTIELPFYSNLNVSFISNKYVDEFKLQDKPGSTIYTVLNKTTTSYLFKDYSRFIDGIDSPADNFTTVNLDNYEYVILNLKDYNQDKAFNTNLKVKGSIGITPIYNFGQTAKDDIMGSKVQDRCNVKYNDYTDYRFSILKQDLQNNSFYVVKGCEVGSSFKFDNTIFDITYVDENNKSDPIVSIGGKDYHVIPFEKLPSSANKNEEENYVPGESEKFTLSSITKNLASTLEGIWNSITSFFSFVTKMFSVLPSEFQAISILTFSTGCILGLIKILKS